MLMHTLVFQSGEVADDLGGDWGPVHQIVVPVVYWQHILELAHEHWWSCHVCC